MARSRRPASVGAWNRLATAASNVRTDATLALTDAGLAVLAFVVALLLRFDGQVPPGDWNRFARHLPVAVGAVLACNVGCGLYRQIWRHASVQEAQRVLAATFAGGVLLSVLDLAHRPHLLPYSVVVMGTMLSGAMSNYARPI